MNKGQISGATPAKAAPKSDRKKLVSTEVVNGSLVWHNAATEAELCRLTLSALKPEIVQKAMIYGLKQIVADVNSDTPAAERLAGIAKAVATIGAGGWPTRESAPKVVSLDLGLDVVLKAMQVKNPKATLDDVKRALGLGA